jgi:hypothetical protein
MTPEQERLFSDWGLVVDTLLDAYDMHEGFTDERHQELLVALYDAPYGLKVLLTTLVADLLQPLRASSGSADVDPTRNDPFIRELVARMCLRAGIEPTSLGVAYGQLAYHAVNDADRLVTTYGMSANRQVVYCLKKKKEISHD